MALNDSKWTWRTVSLISIVTTVILIVGLVYAVSDIIYPVGEASVSNLPQQTAAPVTETAKVLKVVALGDSLAKGTGDNTGEGFVKRTVSGLSAKGVEVDLLGNMGINGLTTAGLQSKLDEDGVDYALHLANVILLSIGGNDLFKDSNILQNSGALQSESTTDQELTPESLLAALPEAAGRLGNILEKITEINPNAQIYYMGLYNPFGDIPDLLVPGNQAVAKWNNAAMDIINKHSNMTLVPTFDLFNRHLDEYLSTDHFHPNGDGYQRIGERFIQAIH
ncbi:GDSL-type esterase/lipase family protein [Paenibacillus sp. FSL K6-0276]|uniref:GDSL-type esterase/lipase family protein n=1 Tax=unclassified Paenibacillus TaxID=185978 RepID=UPI0028A813FC|nr:GDSL-type esterase/lipase family protein [Paenibacillus sp.]